MAICGGGASSLFPAAVVGEDNAKRTDVRRRRHHHPVDQHRKNNPTSSSRIQGRRRSLCGGTTTTPTPTTTTTTTTTTDNHDADEDTAVVPEAVNGERFSGEWADHDGVVGLGAYAAEVPEYKVDVRGVEVVQGSVAVAALQGVEGHGVAQSVALRPPSQHAIDPVPLPKEGGGMNGRRDRKKEGMRTPYHQIVVSQMKTESFIH